MIVKDENDLPYLAIDSARIQAAFEKAIATLNQKDVFANYRLKKYNIDETQLGTFTDGRALFFSDVLFWISGLRDMKDDFAILPRAKYDEAQERYYTYVHECGAWLCISLTADPKRSGYILEELSAESTASSRLWAKRATPVYNPSPKLSTRRWTPRSKNCLDNKYITAKGRPIWNSYAERHAKRSRRLSERLSTLTDRIKKKSDHKGIVNLIHYGCHGTACGITG